MIGLKFQIIPVVFVFGAFGLGLNNTSTPLIANTPPIPELQCGEYSGEFRQCIVANYNGTTRTIDDFPCLQTTDTEKILYQVILDKKFKEYDEEILDYLVDLRMDKEASAEEPLNRIDEFARNFGGQGYYYQKYQDLCERGILEERATCTGGIPLVPAGWSLRGDAISQECMRLTAGKLEVYTDLAAHILGINKEEVLGDRFTRSEIDRREGNNNVQDAFRDVVGFCGKIGDGLTHYTPRPLQ